MYIQPSGVYRAFRREANAIFGGSTCTTPPHTHPSWGAAVGTAGTGAAGPAAAVAAGADAAVLLLVLQMLLFAGTAAGAAAVFFRLLALLVLLLVLLMALLFLGVLPRTHPQQGS